MDEEKKKQIREKIKKDILEQKIEPILKRGADIDVEKYRKFLLHSAEDNCNYYFQRGIGAGYEYTFSSSTIGSGVIVSCPACGHKENITNYDDW